MTSSPSCPYPECGNLVDASRSVVCGCERSYGVEVCGTCGLTNRVDARFCRGCRSLLHPATGAATLHAQPGPLTVRDLPGSFRRPPVKAGGLLYALATSGAVFQISTRPGAAMRRVGQLASPTAAWNRFAVVELAAGASRGWTLLAAGTQGVDAVSLATGAATVLFKPSSPEEMQVNHSDLDGTGFKGLAATAEFCAFLTQCSPDSHILNLIHLGVDRPAEQPILLHGAGAAGPALCGSGILFCTEAQAGRFDLKTRQAFSLNLPSGFRPLLTPTSPDLVLPLGSMPFATRTNPQGEEVALIAGTQAGRAGLLEIDFRAGQTTFRPLGNGSSLTSGADGTAVLRTLEGIELLGSKPDVVSLRTQPGMAAFRDAEALVTFAESDFPRRHRVRVADGPRQAEVRFEDVRCDRYSCCGAFLFEREIVVSYLDMNAPEDGAGMVLAQWPRIAAEHSGREAKAYAN